MRRRLTLQQLNTAPLEPACAWLAGAYENSPWIVEQALPRRPFASLAALERALVEVVREAGREAQLALLRHHPELAGKALRRRTPNAASTAGRGHAGLSRCTPDELDRLRRLNADYRARFGWPFVLAVQGPRGSGLTCAQIIDIFARRLSGPADFEFAECLRNVHRIAELRLDERFGAAPTLGRQVWDCAELLAAHSDDGDPQAGQQLTVTYLSAAHLACQRQLRHWMAECGFDDVRIDAVGNVVGVYHGRGHAASERRLLVGSHFDTVRNGGRYDGRLGILVPLVAVRELHRCGRRLSAGIELVAFAEEEGQRYPVAFLGSGALVGQFDADGLDQGDADGVTLREAMRGAGLPATTAAITAERRDPARYLGFVEVHIEQGPVLDALDLPLGIVSSINGCVRYLGEVTGLASHAGTTPMGQRRDAALAVAELALYVERRAASGAIGNDSDAAVGADHGRAAGTVGMQHAGAAGTVGTVGLLDVPDGSINVVPGRCRFSLDLRAPTDAARDALAADVLAELRQVCARRGVRYSVAETLRAAAAPCAPAWQARWAAAVAALGLPVHRLPSGAGHDAMKLHKLMPQAMLFVRGGNAGISHNPLETVTANDAQLAVEAFQHLIEHLD